ncbi:MAG: chromosomal replication initiator protein DnaA [Verrucomicrobiota bacterium]
MNSTATILDPTDVWSRICVELQKLISPDAFRRWFSSITPMGFDAGKLSLGVENVIYQYWIEENYLPQLREAGLQILGKPISVVFENVAGAESLPQPQKARSIAESLPEASELVARYTFSNFVVGANCQFAHAAAVAVAEAPAKTYNPLFIHGSVGLGKTHLLHAIGNHIRAKKKNARVVYVTSEQFTNEFISAIQHGELIKFRKRYRQAEALLIDDIQFFAGKERSQEEFFHTFNALFDGNKQIVLTSDVPPSEVKNLERRLVSRFEWGLTAELQPPDIETRLAILRKKTAQMQVRLGDTVLQFIAERVKSNIRRLEGALNRVAAWAALHDRQITQAQVEDLLKDFVQQETRHAVTIEVIQKHVAEGFDIRMADMTSKRRPNNIAVPRMVAMYLSRRLTAKSLQEIGEAFGGRDHGTVLHAVKTVEEKLQSDQQIQQMVNFLTTKLSA